jgi:hypothetical protein
LVGERLEEEGVQRAKLEPIVSRVMEDSLVVARASMKPQAVVTVADERILWC